jgi:flagellar hook-associated protein 3 FlgL
MPLGRITHNMIADTFQANLSEISRRLQKVHEELSSGQRLRRPSDDPPSVIQAVSLRSTIQTNDQYLRTIDLSKTWLESTESALNNLTDVLQRARELAVQGANAALGPAERRALANEVDQLVGGAVAAANTSAGGSYVFAGHAITTQPFTVSGSTVTYNGDNGSMSREIGPNLLISINVTGDRSDASIKTVIESLITLRDDLNNNAGSAVSNDVGTIDSALDAVLKLRAETGAKVNRFDFVSQRLQDIKLELTRLLSNTQDVDMAETITRFQLEENVYQSALQAGAKAIQPSLLDFMR